MSGTIFSLKSNRNTCNNIIKPRKKFLKYYGFANESKNWKIDNSNLNICQRKNFLVEEFCYMNIYGASKLTIISFIHNKVAMCIFYIPFIRGLHI